MPQNQSQPLQVKAKDDDLKGAYSNLIQITHMKEEFVFDFFFSAPPQGILINRIVVSPGHAKRIAAALTDAVKNTKKNLAISLLTKSRKTKLVLLNKSTFNF